MRRKAVFAVLILAGLLVLWVLVFPGTAVVQYVTVNSESCTTPEKLQQALDQSGWDYRDDSDYYLVSYSIKVRSFLPFALKHLEPTNLTTASGLRVYQLPTLFADRIPPLGQRVVYCEFLFEVGRDTLTADSVAEFNFALKASGFPASIRVVVPPEAEINLSENPVPG